ncbi:MAG: DUF1343 domain-containing protein [Chitinophagaceae bacterium]|nr:DUF1343 domain-containing protein [Chitinophagaceae bacterium]
MYNPVFSGVDHFLEHYIGRKQQRLALVTNHAATTFSGERSFVALQQHSFRIVKLFSPEHGITSTGEDGAPQQNTVEPATGLPIISLYGNKLAPAEEDLEEVNAVLFDIPDVGCRFYTYLWTMTHVMEACAQFNKPLILLDRPNPIGALLEEAEGPFLDEQNCSSFIGRWNIPLKHACTLGELAQYFAATRIPHLQLEVIPVQNYHRHYRAGQQFSFVPTSPAIQRIEAAMLYPGMGLLEGIEINEGRGTSFPFEQFGAPWINGEELQQLLQPQLPFVEIAAVTYTPLSGVYANKQCRGVRLTVTDSQSFKAVETGIIVLQTLLKTYPQHIKERLYTTHANPTGAGHMDKLLGVKNALEKIPIRSPENFTVANKWQATMRPYLLYTN